MYVCTVTIRLFSFNNANSDPFPHASHGEMVAGGRGRANSSNVKETVTHPARSAHDQMTTSAASQPVPPSFRLDFFSSRLPNPIQSMPRQAKPRQYSQKTHNFQRDQGNLLQCHSP